LQCEERMLKLSLALVLRCNILERLCPKVLWRASDDAPFEDIGEIDALRLQVAAEDM